MIGNFGTLEKYSAWFAFVIALICFSLTVEPTGSFWDAGEYISTSAKLQVGHPPGAPLFQMIGAFFATFAFGASTKIALMVNMVSVFSSAFTVFFTFLIASNLIQKLWQEEETTLESYSLTKTIVILSGSLVASLSLCFSDSFWFNAVETEVYAMASLVMSLLLWLGLKWSDELDSERGHKWLMLIAFVVGLVFGIQFMGFLAIPSIGLLFAFKKYKNLDWKKFVLINIAVIALLFLVFKYSLTYVLSLFGVTEVFFVNQLGLPFNSGTIFMLLLLGALFFYAIKETKKRDWPTAYLVVHCTLFMFIGFSTWFMLPIRANAQTVVNENNPEDARSLLAYYNREQYPSVESPFYGAYYSDQFGPAGPPKDDKPKYEKDLKLRKYVIVNNYKNALQHPDPGHVGLLPRMWSAQNTENYMKYYGALAFSIKPEYYANAELRNAVNRFQTLNQEGQVDTAQYIDFLRNFSEYIDVKPPTLWQNINYMFDFQFGYMYMRYLFWNFVGRQNDAQGRYNGDGEWLSGISFIDAARLGSQKDLPKDLKNNKARNTYFFLPLLLGLIGMIYQAKRNWKQFWVLLVFFLLTGIGIQFYTNPGIFQPRERDYSLVGSFFIFTLWIGIGVSALYKELEKFVQKEKTKLAIAVGALSFLCVPVLMAAQNWDDHDRSGRETARSTAMSYLSSCQEDAGAMIFTIGDNDTFPLWYVQEIENYRTDVRVINSSLFATDWYIDQMKRKAYESDPIPSQLSHDKYKFGTRDVVYYQAIPQYQEQRWDINRFMDWIGSDREETKLRYLLKQQGRDLSAYEEGNLNIVYYPTNKIRVPVDKEKVLSNGLVKAKDSALIVDYIDIDLPSVLPKNRMMMLDILANNKWERPIYFSGGSLDPGEYIYLKDYLQLDGLIYKLVPILTEDQGGFDMGRIDSDLMFDIVTNWDWGNADDPDVYIDPQSKSQGLSYRSNLARLTEQLIAEEKFDKAETIMDLAVKYTPMDRFGFYTFMEPFAEGYYQIGKPEKAQAILSELFELYVDHLNYYEGLTLNENFTQIDRIYSDLEAFRRCLDIAVGAEDVEFIQEPSAQFNSLIESFMSLFGQAEESSDVTELE